jgi:NhaP-type Na+/H+ or K+/H+ antiporter
MNRLTLCKSILLVINWVALLFAYLQIVFIFPKGHNPLEDKPLPMLFLFVGFIFLGLISHYIVHWMFKFIKSSPLEYPGRLWFAASLGGLWFISMTFNLLVSMIICGIIASIDV